MSGGNGFFLNSWCFACVISSIFQMSVIIFVVIFVLGLNTGYYQINLGIPMNGGYIFLIYFIYDGNSSIIMRENVLIILLTEWGWIFFFILTYKIDGQNRIYNAFKAPRKVIFGWVWLFLMPQKHCEIHLFPAVLEKASRNV